MFKNITMKKVGSGMLWTGKAILKIPVILIAVYLALWVVTLAEALVMSGIDWIKNPSPPKPPASTPSVSSSGGNATTFRDMSNNMVQASGGFRNLLPIPQFLSNAMQGSISSGELTKINAAELQMDSVDIFDGGVAYSPVPNIVSDINVNPSYKETGRDAFPDFEENSIKPVKGEPVSTFSIDVDTASYGFMRRSLNEGVLPPKDAVRIEELVNYFPYNYALPETPEEPFKPTVAVYKCPWQPDHKLVHIGIKGYNLAAKPKSNFVFLVDTSGSMNSPDKLPLVINSLKLMLDDLGPDDTVGIVTYAGTAGVALEPVSVSEKSKIIRVLDSLGSGGSTAGAAGIREAYDLADSAFIKEGNNRVILATDGDFNVGINSADDLKEYIEKKRDKGIFLSVLGFGLGNYRDTTMQALAQTGNGNAAYISDLSEARKVLVDEASSTLFTIAKDVKIQVEFNPATVQEYRLIGYETRKLKREDFNNDKVDAGEIGAGHTVTAIYEVTPAGVSPALGESRYDKKEMAAPKVEDKSDFSGELAFLKIRYKEPDGFVSKLMTKPITVDDEKPYDTLSDDVRFAGAVAGFGQLLRHSQYTAGLKWDDVIEMANAARGRDEFGYRSEFVKLVRLAKSEEGNAR